MEHYEVKFPSQTCRGRFLGRTPFVKRTLAKLPKICYSLALLFIICRKSLLADLEILQVPEMSDFHRLNLELAFTATHAMHKLCADAVRCCLIAVFIRKYLRQRR